MLLDSLHISILKKLSCYVERKSGHSAFLIAVKFQVA